MADRTRRVRSRTTPQRDLAHHAAPQTRTTRSQSRDIEPQQELPTAKSSRKGARGASVESTGSVDNTTRRTTRKPPGQDLPVVQEDVSVQYPDLPEPKTQEIAGAREVTPPLPITTNEYTVHQSSGAQSSMSATTAISTAQTVHDPADLDPNLMLELLDDLFRDAAKVLDLVAPKKASAEDLVTVAASVSNPHSHTSRLLEQRVARFASTRENFGAGDYINQATVLASFAGGDDITRPDSVMYKANLATFAKEMVTVEQENDRIFGTLLELDNTFPRPFLSSLYDREREEPTPGSSALVEETFELALDIRTQFAVYLLVRDQNDQGFDPDNTLRSIFFAIADEDEEDGASEMPRLRGWEVLGLGSGDDDLPEFVKTPILQRIEQIRRYFPKGQEALEHGDYVDSDALMAEFPWSDLIIHVLNWARIRNAELDDEIKILGGVSAIHASLEEHLETGALLPRRRSGPFQSQAESLTERESQSQQIPKTAPGVLRVLRDRLARNGLDRMSEQDHPATEPAGEPVPTESVVSQVEQGDHQPPVLDDDEGEVNPPPESSAYQNDLDTLRQRERQNKENMRRVSADPGNTPRKSFIDRQPGATRVPFEDSPMPPTQETSTAGKSPSKRTRAQPDTDTDENEFETRVAERRRKAPVPKRTRYAPSSSAPEQSQARRTAAVEEETQSEDSGDEGPPSGAAQLKAVTQQAHRLSTNPAAVRGGKRKWSPEETNAFIEYIEEFGHEKQPYRKIKEEDLSRGNILKHRDNVALKDKVANIVKAYKRAGQDLPPGFEHLRVRKY